MSGTIEFRRQTTILKYVPPAVALTGAEIGQYADDVVVLTFAGYLNENITPATSLFTVRNVTDSADETISSVSVVNNTVLLTLVSDGVYGKVYTVSYAKGGAQVVLTDANSAIINDFSSYPVTNTVPQGEITAPAFLMNDTYTQGWYIADISNVSLMAMPNDTAGYDRVTQWTDIGPNENNLIHDVDAWQESRGPQYDEATDELIFHDVYEDNYNRNRYSFLYYASYPTISELTVYYVLNINEIQGEGLIGDLLGGDGFPPDIYLHIVSGGGLQAGMGKWTDYYTDYYTGSYGVLVVRYTPGGSSHLQFNQRTPLIGDFGSDPFTEYWIGSTPSISSSANFRLKEIIIRNTGDNQSSINSVVTYLMNKYNIRDE